MKSYSAEVKTQLFHSNGLSMQYASWGSGKSILIAFHGFSRSHRDFKTFTKNLESYFTIYAFDLFFHESAPPQNRQPDKYPLKPNELKSYFEEFLKSIQAEKVWIMGYSLGGRIALKLAEITPEKIGGLYLFAPDGLIVNSWYAILSCNTPGRALFRFFIRRNAFFLKVLNTINRLGFISEKRKMFVLSHIRTADMQWKIYNVWTFLRKINPKISLLGRALSANGISVDLFMGKYDRIIPIKNSRRLEKVFPKLELHILNSGHVMLLPHISQLIANKKLMQLP